MQVAVKLYRRTYFLECLPNYDERKAYIYITALCYRGIVANHRLLAEESRRICIYCRTNDRQD